MSWFDAIYGRPGRGVDPNEPEKTGLRRFAQMVGRDFGQLIGTNFLACLLLLPAALAVSLGVILLNFPFTLLAGLVTGLPAGVGLLLLTDCALRSLCNDPSAWLSRAGHTVKTKWKAALPLGAIAITLLGALSFVCAFLFEVMQGGQYPGGAVLVFLGFDLLVLAGAGSLPLAALTALPDGDVSFRAALRGAGQMLLLAPARSLGGSAVIFAGAAVLILFFPISTFWAMLFGFWLPALVAMQIFFPVLRQLYRIEVERPAAPAEEDGRPLTAKEKRRRSAAKPKICRFCEAKVRYIDFKDAETLMKFQTEKGKIMPRRITGNCLDHQKMLATAVKRARIIALVY